MCPNINTAALGAGDAVPIKLRSAGGHPAIYGRGVGMQRKISIIWINKIRIYIFKIVL